MVEIKDDEFDDGKTAEEIQEENRQEFLKSAEFKIKNKELGVVLLIRENDLQVYALEYNYVYGVDFIYPGHFDYLLD